MESQGVIQAGSPLAIGAFALELRCSMRSCPWDFSHRRCEMRFRGAAVPSPGGEAWEVFGTRGTAGRPLSKLSMASRAKESLPRR